MMLTKFRFIPEINNIEIKEYKYITYSVLTGNLGPEIGAHLLSKLRKVTLSVRMPCVREHTNLTAYNTSAVFKHILSVCIEHNSLLCITMITMWYILLPLVDIHSPTNTDSA